MLYCLTNPCTARPLASPSLLTFAPPGLLILSGGFGLTAAVKGASHIHGGCGAIHQACFKHIRLTRPLINASPHLELSSYLIHPGVDSSEPAIRLAEANAELNGVQGVAEFTQADISAFMKRAVQV